MNKSVNASQFPIEIFIRKFKISCNLLFPTPPPSFLMFLIFLFTTAWYRQSDEFVELDRHFVSIVSAVQSICNYWS